MYEQSVYFAIFQAHDSAEVSQKKVRHLNECLKQNVDAKSVGEHVLYYSNLY